MVNKGRNPCGVAPFSGSGLPRFDLLSTPIFTSNPGITVALVTKKDSPAVRARNRPAKNGMTFRFARLLAALALLGSLDGLATAQTGGAGRPVVIPNTSATAASTGPAAAASTEPAELTGMLAAQNEARKRVGVPALKWSSELAVRAEATAKVAGKGSCSVNAAERTAKAENASYYWASGMRRFAGGDTAQDISASYLVSRWREGNVDYDAAKGLCRSNTPSCDAYSRMIAPAARSVGCARNICSNQAQVWICVYSEQSAH
jgi:hypothetical protein